MELLLTPSNQKEISVDNCGQKSVGLTQILQYTPKFCCITDKLYSLWITDLEEYRNQVHKISSYLSTYFGKDKDLLIRSSSISEGLETRGLYKTLAVRPSDKVEVQIENVFSDFKQQSIEDTLALLIQEKVEALVKGHLSNERRVSRNCNNWIIEVESTEVVVSNMTRRFNSLSRTQDSTSLKAFSYHQAEAVLMNIARQFTHGNCRYHFEWIWDGSMVFLVQKDEEIKSWSAVPGSQWKMTRDLSTSLEYNVLRRATGRKEVWRKLDCLRVFKNIGLPTADVLLLSDVGSFDDIIDGKTPKALKEDFEKILAYPVVIRTDIADIAEGFLLPRTDTVRTVDQAVTFIRSTIAMFVNKQIDLDRIAFLIHHYIPSRVCALTYVNPQMDKVKIDATYGLPDGLHCFSYDSYEYNLSGKEEIHKKIRCKSHYLDCNNTGEWLSIKCGWNIDWGITLSERMIMEISNYSIKIAKELKNEVGIMFFVDVLRHSGHPEILPWYFTTEIPQFNAEPSQVVFPRREFVIRNSRDFEHLKKNVRKNELVVRLQIAHEDVRNRELINEIGVYLHNHEIPTILEGSVLSHIYYLLSRLNVNIRCRDPFNPSYKEVFFNKLVRDRIPEKIESHGEQVVVRKLNKFELMEMLKQKMVEEALEFNAEREIDGLIEEAADIYEVMLSIMQVLGVDFKRVKNRALNKRRKTGSFVEGVYLIRTKDLPALKEQENVPNKLAVFHRKMSEKIVTYSWDEDKLDLQISIIPPTSRRIKQRTTETKGREIIIGAHYDRDVLRVELERRKIVSKDQLTLF